MNYVLVLPAFVIDVVQFVLKRVFYNMTLTSAFKSKLKSRECCTFFDLQNFYNIKLNNVVKTTRTSVFLQHYGHKAGSRSFGKGAML